MSTDPKIYTAAEVASVGFSKEDINQILATITQEAYEAAKHGDSNITHHSANQYLLYRVARRLRGLGYATKVIESAIGEHCIIVHWAPTKPTGEAKK